MSSLCPSNVRASSIAGLQRLYVAPENPNHKYPMRRCEPNVCRYTVEGWVQGLQGPPHNVTGPKINHLVVFLFISNTICLLKKC